MQYKVENTVSFVSSLFKQTTVYKLAVIYVTFSVFVDIDYMKQKIINIEQLYDDYYGDVYGFAFWLCGNSDDAQDIASETFVRLLTASSKIKAETIKGYLITIARNIYLQGLRRKNKKEPLDSDLIDSSPEPDDATTIQMELNNVIKTLQEMNEINRTAM